MKIYKTNRNEETNKVEVLKKLRQNLILAQREQPPTVGSTLELENYELLEKEHDSLENEYKMPPGALWDIIEDLDLLWGVLGKVMQRSGITEKELQGYAHLVPGRSGGGRRARTGEKEYARG